MSTRAIRRWLIGGAVPVLAAACASAPRVADPPVVSMDTVPAPPPPPPPPDTMGPWRVPDFRPLPIVTWGAPPPGVAHGARSRTFDLRHQIVRVGFDREHRVVRGSTTLRVSRLAGGPPTSTVALDAVGMTIGRVAAAGNGDAPLRYEYDGRTLIVHLAEPLPRDRSTDIEIEYEVVRPASGVRFVERRGVVWAGGRPAHARYWVPTVDQPGEQATWEVHVRTAADEMALSNGRLVASRPAGDAMEWHWSLESPASTSLMAVVTGEYVVLQDQWREVLLGYWTYPDSVAAAWRAFGKTPRMIDFVGGLTGVKYPWSTYDQVVVPPPFDRGADAVTAAIMPDDAALYPGWAAHHAAAPAEDLVMHRLAHQWFGGLVTMRAWGDAWLGEAFARMLEASWREVEHGSDEAELSRLAAREAALAEDVRARRPLVYDRWDADPGELFAGDHLEARGAAVLEMLRAEVGDSLFWLGVRELLTAHAHGSIATSDLRAALERVSGRDLSRFFAQWVRGAGHPVFRIGFTFDSNASVLSLEAAQVQPRDSLTGYFDATVAVTVLTDSGAVGSDVVVADSLTRATIRLPAAPLAIIWGSDGRTLHSADFPRSVMMLSHQLAHATTARARIEAAQALGERTDEPRTIAALARAARSDAFWAVRRRAATVLGRAMTQEDSAATALLVVTRDADARVREAAARALGELSLPDPLLVPLALARLGAILPPDSSAAATNALRAARIDRLEELITDDESRYVRAAAMRSLAMLDRRPETVELLHELLADASPIVRAAAARALAFLGDEGSIGALEGRLAVEEDARVREALVDAVQRLRAGVM